MLLTGKTAIVTGASRGIGRGIAMLMAKAGARVVVNYHQDESRSDASEVVQTIANSGGEAMLFQADVACEDDVRSLIDQSYNACGHLDILVNNAGVVYDVPFLEKTVQQWQTTLNTNLVGVFLCSKYFSQKTTTGCIVNISSTSGINSLSPDCMDYDASKAGVVNLTKNLAKQLSPNIRVNAIAPGWVNTMMNEGLPAEYLSEEKKLTYLGRFAKPEEIAHSVLFLASDQAGYINGETIKVDGGRD